MTTTLGTAYDASCLTKVESALANWINNTAEFESFTSETDPGDRLIRHVYIDAPPFAQTTDELDRDNIPQLQPATLWASKNFAVCWTDDDGFNLVYDSTDSEYKESGVVMFRLHKLLTDSDIAASEVPWRDFAVQVGKIMDQMGRSAVDAFAGARVLTLNSISRQHQDRRYTVGDELLAMITVTYDLTTEGGT